MMVIGHVGAKTQNPKPSVLPLTAVIREFQQIRKKVAGEGEPPSWFKTGKNNLCDWTPKAGEPTIDLPNDTDEWRIVAYPVAIPLVYGHNLVAGDITNADVRAQLVAYHPAMEGWLDAISLQLITNKPLGDTKKIPSKYLPKLSDQLSLAIKPSV
eukprot:scaffold315206_cov43-Attheya_sp.AAC.1